MLPAFTLKVSRLSFGTRPEPTTTRPDARLWLYGTPSTLPTTAFGFGGINPLPGPAALGNCRRFLERSMERAN